MPTPALALLGFMQMNLAINFLLQRCTSTRIRSGSEAKQEWLVAKNRLGQPDGNPGKPEVLDVPSDALPYVEGLENNPRFVEAQTTGDLKGIPWSFRLVEISPIIAFQFWIETDRSDAFGGGLTSPPSIEQAFSISLPKEQETVEVEPLATGTLAKGEVLLRSPSMNLRSLKAGLLADPDRELGPWELLPAGVEVGLSLPFIQVAKFEERYYLRNGYHRAYALAVAGATHVPCILLETSDWGQIGARGKGATFERNDLRGSNPPTVGHFVRGKATAVQLRTTTRVIRLTWEETEEVEGRPYRR